MTLTQKQKDMIREAATGGPRNWQRAMNVALIIPGQTGPVTAGPYGPSLRSASNDENQDRPSCEHATERGQGDHWGRESELRPGAQAPVAGSTTAKPAEAAAAEEQAKAPAGEVAQCPHCGRARPQDYTLSRSDWRYVDWALTDLAAYFERTGHRGNANEVRELCYKFFKGFETIIRDVQSC